MIYSQRHRCAVYSPGDYGGINIRAIIPAARALGNGDIAVPMSIPTGQTLRLLGLPVPSLMDIEYDWPIMPGRVPFAHQRATASFLTMHPRAFCLNDMGTAKTLSALWAADYLMSRKVIRRALVISPLTVMAVWENEVGCNLIGRRKGVMLYGSRQKRLDLIRQPADFYYINHDGLGIGAKKTPRHLVRGDLAELIATSPEIDLVIVDEASAYKDYGALRTRVLRSVLMDKPYVWLLTGTPTPNAPTDAWALKKLISPNYPETFFAFRERTMVKVSNFKWAPRRGSDKASTKLLQPAIRFSRDECVDLPTCFIPPPIKIDLSEEQRRMYNELKKRAILYMNAGEEISAVNEGVLRSKLLQVLCGAVYDKDHKPHKVDAGPRVAAALELINQSSAKTLVFAPFTSVVDMLYNEISKHHPTCRITGGTSRAERADILTRFEKDTDVRVIVADPGTMSHGVTAVAASTIVWYGPTDRPETYQQANDRINRIGQKRKTFIARLSASALETEIYQRLESKQSLQGSILKLIGEGR